MLPPPFLRGWGAVSTLTLLTMMAVNTADAIDPFISGIFGGAAIMGGLYKWGYDGVYCYANECYDPRWVTNNVTKIELLLDEHVFGQHLVQNVVLRALRSHLRKRSRSPSKALTLSFHGWTGSGKNYVAKFIAEGLYKEGMQSKFVHLFLSTYHFPHPGKADEYRLQLQDWIRGNVTVAPQSLFIFDEIDKMPEGVIDALKPFIDHHETVGGVDFRHCIFIFLSNTGGKAITRRTLELWEEGRAREDLRYEDYEQLINVGAFNERGGLHQSTVLERSLVDFFLPFLPMDRAHVRKCIEAEARSRAILDEDVDGILDRMEFWPSETRLFSTTGCKKVRQKVEQVLEGYLDDLR